MQAQRNQCAQVVTFLFRAVNGVFQRNRIPYIGIVKRDVEVPHQHQIGVSEQFIAHPVSQALEPVHLVIELVAAWLLPIGEIPPNDTNGLLSIVVHGERATDDP